MNLSRLRAPAALALAAAAGVALPAIRALDAPPPPPDAAGALDDAIAGMGVRLPAGARVAVGLPADPSASGQEMARWYLVQYALAPAVAVPVVLPACLDGGPAGCGLDGVAYLALVGVDPDAAAEMGERFGFSPLARSDATVLLARSAR